MQGAHHPFLVRNPRPRDFRLRCRLAGERGPIIESLAHVLLHGLSGFGAQSILNHAVCRCPRLGEAPVVSRQGEGVARDLSAIPHVLDLRYVNDY